MTREAFIEILKKKGYSYKLEGDKIVITHGKKGTGLDNHIYLDDLVPDIIFANKGMVKLEDNITSLPYGLEFRNGGEISGSNLEEIEYPLIFQNRGTIQFHRLEKINPGVVFNNKGDVYIKNIGAIERKARPVGYKKLLEGISDKRLLNLMIKRGLITSRSFK